MTTRNGGAGKTIHPTLPLEIEAVQRIIDRCGAEPRAVANR